MAKRRADGSYKLSMAAGDGRADGTGSLDARARRDAAVEMVLAGKSTTAVMARYPMSRAALETAVRDRQRADAAAADLVAGKAPELVMSLCRLPVYTINAALTRLGREDLHLRAEDHRPPPRRDRGHQRPRALTSDV